MFPIVCWNRVADQIDHVCLGAEDLCSDIFASSCDWLVERCGCALVVIATSAIGGLVAARGPPPHFSTGDLQEESRDCKQG